MQQAPVLTADTPATPRAAVAPQVASSRDQETVFNPGELKPGQSLDGTYEIIEMLRRGGMACIYKARDIGTGRLVAVKVPHLRMESDPAGYLRFQHEEEVACSLDHPYILKVRVPGHLRSRPYLVTELLEGKTLDRIMASSAPMNEADAVRIASQVCDGLEYLRLCGVVHRDIKPDNIMVCSDGTIRIFDFGIAAGPVERGSSVGPGWESLGTPEYMSPEQVLGRRADHRADLFSLGAVLFQMVTGRMPYESDDGFIVMQMRVIGDPPAPRSLNPKVSPVMEEIVLQALSREPADRFATAGHFKRALEHYESVPLTGRCDRLKPPRIRFWHANPWMYRGLLLTAGAFVALAAVFGVAIWLFIGRAGK